MASLRTCSKCAPPANAATRTSIPPATDARICSFECTFCATCADETLKGKCPNCGGGLVQRPARAADKLAKYPASTKRIVKADGCKTA